MMNSALFWLFCNLLSIVVLAFYSMLEMACVSFNKVRLQYYVSKGLKRAIWLNYLLQHPSRLFGTTLIGVNIALVIGSECSRQFYAALGISPDVAPLTQVILVVIFGELAPMFAARHYAENVAMLGIPLVYASAKIMSPLLWVVGIISKICNKIVKGSDAEANIYLTQEELQKLIEEHEEEPVSDSESAEFTAVSANIFNLRQKDVKKIMEPLNSIKALPSNSTISELESLLDETSEDYVLIYHREPTNIVGIAYPRDTLRVAETRRLRDYARPPWFVTENMNILQILRQFRSNHENVAVILNHHGRAIGVVTLENVLEEIFGKISLANEEMKEKKKAKLMIIEKTFPGDMTVEEFDKQFGILLDPNPSLTLSNLIMSRLNHRPEKGETVLIGSFEITVKETTLLDIKSVTISTRVRE